MLRSVVSHSVFNRTARHYAAMPYSTINAVVAYLQGRPMFNQAVENRLIDLTQLQRFPKEKVAEINTLLDPQKYYPSALSFIKPHELFSIEELMNCEIKTILDYKAYIYQISPAEIKSGAIPLVTFKTFPAAVQSDLAKDPEEPSRYWSPCGK